tara:strand:+ start:416 stop:1279 length:864 start_codon:yes stop_codon:yes gene_type:complete
MADNYGHLAAIQYLGEPGISQHCRKAVMDLVQGGHVLVEVKLLTCEAEYSASHCLLIRSNYEVLYAVKSGFASGYSGEGPRALSYVLELLSLVCDDINEYVVSASIIERVDHSCLYSSDIEQLESARCILPQRWHDYIQHPRHGEASIFGEFPVEIPYSLIDARLIPFALKFKNDPDAALIGAYRLLEEEVRRKAGIEGEQGSRLFSLAFIKDQSPLCWEKGHEQESAGRAQLFSQIFMAFRNPRVHRKINTSLQDDVREFLLINQLFVLEAASRRRPEQPEGGAGP